MYAQKLETLPPPPGVIGSLKAGFDVVSSHILLILMPLALDLFLWLGPRLSVGNLYSSLLSDWLDFNRNAGIPVQNVQVITQRVDILGRANMMNLIRTLPIGIPSLLSGLLPDSLPVQTPLGIQRMIQVPSVVDMLGWLLLLTIVGWIGGGLYFRWVSGTVLGHKETAISPLRAMIQTFFLSVVWVMVLVAIFIPIVLVVTALMMINPLFASAALFIMAMLSFWVIVPLFFVPHGIFVRRQNAFHSILNSFKMARFTLPTSGMFVLSSFVLSTGLNYLWSVPKSNSWMTLVGIGGHAFITTALLAASFVYYRDMNVWLHMVLEELQHKNKFPARPI
jgi:hypothetical protein